TFAIEVLAASPAPQQTIHPARCDQTLADANAGIAEIQTRIKSINGKNQSEMCTATRLYFLAMVKARAVTAACKSGGERERDLNRFDVTVASINDAIAERCL